MRGQKYPQFIARLIGAAEALEIQPPLTSSVQRTTRLAPSTRTRPPPPPPHGVRPGIQGKYRRAIKFIPPTPNSIPKALFPATVVVPGQPARFVRTTADGRRHCLVFVDGSCLHNGASNSRAGWAIIPGPDPSSAISGRLEKRGHRGDAKLYAATSNRAELRAALAALLFFRDWAAAAATTTTTTNDNDNNGGGGGGGGGGGDIVFSSIVVATDSQLLVDGMTRWCVDWMSNGWMKMSKGQPVKNVDLWKALLEKVAEMKKMGVVVGMWKVKRRWNSLADAEANRAAMRDEEGGEEGVDVDGFVHVKEERGYTDTHM